VEDQVLLVINRLAKVNQTRLWVSSTIGAQSTSIPRRTRFVDFILETLQSQKLRHIFNYCPDFIVGPISFGSLSTTAWTSRHPKSKKRCKYFIPIMLVCAWYLDFKKCQAPKKFSFAAGLKKKSDCLNYNFYLISAMESFVTLLRKTGRAFG